MIPQFKIWLSAMSRVSGMISSAQVNRNALHQMSEMLLDLSSCGLDERVVRKLEMPEEDFECYENNIVLLINIDS
ncbi:MAG: hypothetical protein FJ088_09310 [Deltaproteobacteria bacterium]|nr:hypothetical protein [Deltaproteobacteria bacterium]